MSRMFDLSGSSLARIVTLFAPGWRRPRDHLVALQALRVASLRDFWPRSAAGSRSVPGLRGLASRRRCVACTAADQGEGDGFQATGIFRGAADRQPASRQLSRRHRKFVALQERYDCIYCVVDLHAITVWQNPAELRRNIREVTAAFIACGIDPKRHIVFNQSQVAEHAELAWVFNCVARLGWLNRMTQFKEKAGKDRENASIGLYDYPMLMAADILVYRATHVPVGDDQKQHLELSRDIAQKFNNDFADSIAALGLGDAFFPLPEPLIQGPATRVMSLRDGTKKMSKSDPSDYSRINLSDDADAIAKKIRKAKTDPEPLPSEEKGLEGRPEADNLVGIYAALADTGKAPCSPSSAAANSPPSRRRWPTLRSRSSRRSPPR